MAWIPFDQQDDAAVVEAIQGPYEGVPDWLVDPLYTWCARLLRSDETLNRLQMDLRLSPPLRKDVRRESPGSTFFKEASRFEVLMEDHCLRNHQFWMRVVDWTVFNEGYGGELQQLLDRAGSVYTVRDERLSRRTDPVTTAAAEAVLSAGGSPAVHLSRAWNAAYAVEPQPSLAYFEAIKAVEAAAKPVIEPKNAAATLGTMIGALDGNPGKWSTRLDPHPPRGNAINGVQAVSDLMKLLWQSQKGRHGESDLAATAENTLSESEDAIRIALTLVHLFSSSGMAVS